MVSPSLSRGTGFLYQFPGVTLQRINSEQIVGPPTGSSAVSRLVSQQKLFLNLLPAQRSISVILEGFCF